MHLQEAGTIQELSDKWWEARSKDENGNEIDCEADKKEQSDTAELGMDNVGGVFLVLAVGILLSIFVGILEFIWSIRRTSIDERVNKREDSFSFHSCYSSKLLEMSKKSLKHFSLNLLFFQSDNSI